MKIHCDWENENNSMAVTFDDEESDEACDSYNDFEKFLKCNDISHNSFKLKGSKTSSMVINMKSNSSCEGLDCRNNICTQPLEPLEPSNVPADDLTDDQDLYKIKIDDGKKKKKKNAPNFG